jgi:hypothetical protein
LFPRFFGITKTFRPVLSPPLVPELDEADDVDVPVVEDELDELHAASRIDAMTRGTARPAVCLSCM